MVQGDAHKKILEPLPVYVRPVHWPGKMRSLLTGTRLRQDCFCLLKKREPAFKLASEADEVVQWCYYRAHQGNGFSINNL